MLASLLLLITTISIITSFLPLTMATDGGSEGPSDGAEPTDGGSEGPSDGAEPTDGGSEGPSDGAEPELDTGVPERKMCPPGQTIFDPLGPTADGCVPVELQQEQEQLVLDILTENGLTPLNDTTAADGNGGGMIEKCAVSSDGHTFCYEPLPTDENCLKPIKVDDPPLCSAK
jgi:hypothetical protein